MSTSIQSILALLTTIGITISLGLVLLNILLFIISIRIPAVEFYARLLAAYLSLMLCALYGVFASIFLRLVGYGGIAQWATARSFKYVMGWTIGVYFTVEDPDNILGTTRPAVFIGNHQSELDVLMLGAMFPQYCSVSAKSQLRRMPFLGWFMALSGTVFIDRANSSNAREAMAGAANQITKQNQSVYMFPEGTRSYFTEAGLLPFKKGAFHLAVQAGVPIVPVVVANYADVLDVKGRVFKTGSVPIKVLKPIETKNLKSSDVDALTRDTRELMLKEIIELTEKHRGSPLTKVATKPDGVTKATGVQVVAS